MKATGTDGTAPNALDTRPNAAKKVDEGSEAVSLPLALPDARTYGRMSVREKKGAKSNKSEGKENEGEEGAKTLQFIGNEGYRWNMIAEKTERAGFEPAEQFDPFAALAKRCGP